MAHGPRSDARGVVTAERVAVWGLAALAVVALAGLVVGPGADLRTAAPDASFDVTFDNTTGTVAVTHAGGDTLGRGTDELAVVVTDADRNATTRVVWAADDTLPVGPGATLTVDDPSVDADDDGNYLDGDRSVGFYLAQGDEVAVVWTGRLLGAPGTRSATLESATIGAPE